MTVLSHSRRSSSRPVLAFCRISKRRKSHVTSYSHLDVRSCIRKEREERKEILMLGEFDTLYVLLYSVFWWEFSILVCCSTLDKYNNILYCSRNIIPSNKKENIITGHLYNIHVGIFVFDKKYLINFFLKKYKTHPRLHLLF